MGVRHLTPLLKRAAPSAIKVVPLSAYRSRTVAVDGLLYLHRALYAPIPHPHSHLVGFLTLSRRLILHGIRPFFVFDGSASQPEKAEEQERRRRLKAAAEWELQAVHRREDRLKEGEKLLSEFNALALPASAEGKARAIWMTDRVRKELGDALHATWPEYNPLTAKMSIAAEKFVPSPRDQALRDRYDVLVHRLLHPSPENPRPTTLPPVSRGEKFLQVKEMLFYAQIFGLTAAERHQDLLMTCHNTRIALETRTASVTANHIGVVKELLGLLGIPYMVSEGHEAEAMCSSLVREGLAAATLSEDTDVLAFGDGPLLRQMSKTRSSGPAEWMEMRSDVAREALGLSPAAWIDLCILCGTDFSGTLEKIGYVRALKHMQTYGSIEALLQAESPTPREGWDYTQARAVFARRPTIPADIRQIMQGSKENVSGMASFLEKYDLADFNTVNEIPIPSSQGDFHLPQWPENGVGEKGVEGLGPNPFIAGGFP